ncbi:MAG: DUF1385 domain-containing protein [Oscillospiraceae bacterium]|nr:DUF1385 domain-containing protein [Oscillospiraceae bacterium]
MTEKFRTSIGGQAVLEGIMMRGPEKAAVVVRDSKGELHSKEWDLQKSRSKKHIMAWPFLRGLFGFGSSMKLGMKALNFSADIFAAEEEAEKAGGVEEHGTSGENHPPPADGILFAKEGKDEASMPKKENKALQGLLTAVAMVLGIVLAVGLFTILPTFLVGLLPIGNALLRGFIEGVVRLLVFLVYLLSVSLMKDIRRTFAYHGAEHMTIATYEAGETLTVENVRKLSRLHPRCGTSFLLNVIVISMLLFFWVQSGDMLIRIGLRLALLPFVVMLAFEFNRWAGRNDNWLSRVLRAPGLWFQKITTKEPDDGMIEVAIAAMQKVVPQEKGIDAW